MAKFLEIIHFFNLHDSCLGRHVNAASRKSLEIQGYSITKPRTLLKQNLYKNRFSAALMHRESKILVGSIVF